MPPMRAFTMRESAVPGFVGTPRVREFVAGGPVGRRANPPRSDLIGVP